MNFKKGMRLGICLLAGFASSSFGSASPSVVFQPLHFGANTFYGKVNGDTASSYGASKLIDDQPIRRTSGWTLLGATVNERFDVSVLLAAMLWYPLPEQGGLPHTTYKFLGAGLGEASGTYKFGDLNNPYLKIKAGLFDYKYSNSSNLGEYLFRSGTYPGYIWSGGWNVINSASYQAEGVAFMTQFMDNSLKVDFGAFIDRNFGPNHDISPWILAKYKYTEVVEIGAGIVFNKLIEMSKNSATPQKRSNAYTTRTYILGADTAFANRPLSSTEETKPGFDTSYFWVLDNSDNTGRIGTEIKVDSVLGITQAMVDEATRVHNQLNKGKPRYLSIEDNGVPTKYIDYYTFAGQKANLFFNLKPLKALDIELFGIENSSFYGEIALLGVKDYPFYYEKKSERMPWTLGMNLEIERFNFIFEYEKVNGKFNNDIKQIYDYQLPLWYLGQESDEFVKAGSTQNALQSFFSITAKAKIVPGLGISFQYARDHLRSFDYFANPSYESMFQKKADNYWLLQLEMGI